MIVDGGDAQTIGETIFLKKGEGVGTHGTTVVTYVDTYGFPNTIRFSRPTVVPIYAKLKITAAADYLSSVSDEIKERIAEYINSLEIGKNVNIARVLASAVKDCDIGVDTRFEVDEITLGKSSESLSASSIDIAWNEAASCDIANVTIEVSEDELSE